MKKLLSITMAAMVLLSAASCDKESKPGKIQYGADGKTPLPEAVDIGMVVDGHKVLWASFNLGASSESGFGDYYAWGETEAKATDKYNWANYKYGLSEGGSVFVSKYCSTSTLGSTYWTGDGKPDGKTSLLPEDDAAHLKLGGKWRIPTGNEVGQLWVLSKDDNYEFKWTSVKGVSGLRITQLATGNSIFLPAAGTCDGKSSVSGTSTGGSIWSSIIDSGAPHTAMAFTFSSLGVGRPNVKRCNGLSIRPVYVE